MLLNCCYCPYIRTILKYVHHFANIAKNKNKSMKFENNQKKIVTYKELSHNFTKISTKMAAQHCMRLQNGTKIVSSERKRKVL